MLLSKRVELLVRIYLIEWLRWQGLNNRIKAIKDQKVQVVYITAIDKIDDY